jgi:hypothetical protein
MPEQGNEEKVGYRKPPRHSQFKKGQSGNPSGRRKRPGSIEEAIEAEAGKMITFTTPSGKRGRISPERATIRGLVHKAAKGDIRAARLLFRIMRSDVGRPPTFFHVDEIEARY